MKKVNKIYIKNKKEKYVANKKSILSTFFASILKLALAVALFAIFALIVNAGDVIVENGKLNVNSKLFVNDAGNVGIGTTGPAQILDVSSGSNPTIRIRNTDTTISNEDVGAIEWFMHDISGPNVQKVGAYIKTFDFGSTGEAIGFKFGVANGAAAADSVVINNLGNVGIGTTSPAAKLDVAQQDNSISVGCSGATCWTNANGIIGFPGFGINHGEIAYYPDSDAFAFIDSSQGGPSADYGSLATIFNNGATLPSLTNIWARNIISSGNVGIGTTNPSSKLHISGITFDNAASGLTLGGTWPWTYYKDTEVGHGSWANYVDGDYFIKFIPDADENSADLSTVGTTYVTVKSTGNVGIGDTGPNQKLHVTGGNIKTEGTGAGGGEIHIYNTAGSGTVLTKLVSKSTGFGVDVSGTERLTVSTAGNVGIGTTSPGALLHVMSSDVAATAPNTNAVSVIERNTATAWLEFLSPTTANEVGILWSDSGGNPGLVKYDHSTDDLTLDSTGDIVLSSNVGIGTSSPAAKLEVNGNIGFTYHASDLYVNDAGCTSGGVQIASHNGIELCFRSNQ